MENLRKEKVKITPEELFDIFIETNSAGAPVKQILERYHLKPWELAIIRKKIRGAALEVLASGRKNGKKQVVSLEEYLKLSRELENTKDALGAVAHELALLKKKMN